MGDAITTGLTVTLIPVYVYILARVITMAVVRSYFEVRKEFTKP